MAKKQDEEMELTDVISEDNEVVAVDLKDVSTNAKIDDSLLVRVKSNVFGKLIYKDRKSGDIVIWTKNGEVQTMSVAELRSMRANMNQFFSNNWVILIGIEDETNTNVKIADIYKSLGITKYYANMIDTTDYKKICNWTLSEIKQNISIMNNNMKTNLVVALNEFIKKGILDSVKKIKAFEEALGCDLTESE